MNNRLYLCAGLVAAGSALAFAYYLEYALGLEPCPLCIFQRVAMLSVMVVCAIGMLHGPQAAGRRIYAVLGGLSALAGAAIAARHVWLMHLPADQVPACGPGLGYLMDVMPWQQVLAEVLRGDASCATVKGSFAGLSLPAWTLIYFLMLLFGALVGLFAPARPDPYANRGT